MPATGLQRGSNLTSHMFHSRKALILDLAQPFPQVISLALRWLRRHQFVRLA